MATQIRHVAIRTTDSQQSRLVSDFYGELFRMRHNNRVSDGYVWAALSERGPARQAGIDHFGFVLDNREEVIERCQDMYPDVEFIMRPHRGFAEVSTHDPAGNVFDLYQKKPEEEVLPDVPPRYLSHFQVRTLHPRVLADFYQNVYGLSLEPRADDDPSFALTDGRVTLVLAPWSIRDYDATGIARPAMDHLGFKVESLKAFQRDLDELRERRPELFPAFKKEATEAARMLEILRASCHRGEFQLLDPDGWPVDVSET
jgi:catechol-2,3-dioxygenase